MKIVTSRCLTSDKEIQQVEVSKGARILSVCVKQEKILVFFEEDVNKASYRYDTGQVIEFAVFRDGRHFYTDKYEYLGTIVINFGNEFYHVFYRFV